VNFYGIQDIVLAPDGKILVGGDDIWVNGHEVPMLRLNADGTIDSTFSFTGLGTIFNSRVYAVLLQPDGKIVLAGSYFTSTSGGTKNIVRLNSNGTRDTAFVPGNPGYISNAFLTPNGKIVYSLWGVIGRLNSDGTNDNGFSAVSGFTGGGVNAIVQQADGKTLVGGTFTGNNGELRDRLLRVNPSGGSEGGFSTGVFAVPNTFYNPQVPFYSGVNSVIFAPESKVYVAGLFSAYDGVPRSNLLRLIDTGPTPTPR
jgi:uncharacterized delta-60 repeat protein